MKKSKLFFVIVLIAMIITETCFFAQAAESGVMVTSEGMSVRELSQEEISALSNQMTIGNVGEEASSLVANTSSYTAYEYSESFNFSLNGTWVARADAKCIVWHYTDGKVHLYQRTITVTRLTTYDATRTYGRIVNTDGSLSYTTGDRVGIIGYDNSWDFAIDFRVTPTEASFNCYEV